MMSFAIFFFFFFFYSFYNRTIYDESCLDLNENEIESKDEHIEDLHAH